MGLRYEEVTEDVWQLFREVKSQYFSELKNAKIKLLFDKKKRMSGGRIVLGRIMLTNDLLRHLTKGEAQTVEGYDYIITLDRTGWELITREDRIRILRHELRHASFEPDSENRPYRLLDHSFQDFYEEVELNSDDPRWRERVATLVNDIYEQQKEEQKARGKKSRDRQGE